MSDGVVADRPRPSSSGALPPLVADGGDATGRRVKPVATRNALTPIDHKGTRWVDPGDPTNRRFTSPMLMRLPMQVRACALTTSRSELLQPGRYRPAASFRYRDRASS